jgi:hypothetical protein
MQQLQLRDLVADGSLADAKFAELSSGLQVLAFHRPVDYVDAKPLRLSSPADFQRNRYYDIYFDSMFKKDRKFESDREYRLVFCLYHPTLGFISVRKTPKILQLSPIAACVEPE